MGETKIKEEKGRVFCRSFVRPIPFQIVEEKEGELKYYKFDLGNCGVIRILAEPMTFDDLQRLGEGIVELAQSAKRSFLKDIEKFTVKWFSASQAYEWIFSDELCILIRECQEKKERNCGNCLFRGTRGAYSAGRCIADDSPRAGAKVLISANPCKCHQWKKED